MLHWKRLLVMDKFENERLRKIVPAAFGEMEFKSILDLPTWKPPKETAKK